MKLLLFLFISSQLALIKGDDPSYENPCPFNEQECLCVRDYKHPKQTTFFSYVNCTSLDGTLPKFEVLPDAKYNVTGSLSIYGADLSKIPANHFDAFSYIAWFNLNQTRAEPTVQEWDDRAFEGLQVQKLEVTRLDGLIPIPKAIKNLGLQIFMLRRAAFPVVLADNTFEGIPLNELSFDHVMIDSISEKAFAGLEDSLQFIEFTNADIFDFTAVGKAIKGFKNLVDLNLGGNYIKEIKKGDLQGLSSLSNLDLTANPVSNIEQGAFPSDLIRLMCVTLSGSHIVSLDVAPFVDLPKESVMPSLSNFNLFMQSSGKLRSLNTSITDRFATDGYIGAFSTNLETVDPKIGELVNNVPDLYVDISYNAHLHCDTLNWLSKFDCPGRISIDGTQCADHNQMPLEDYLKSIDPESTCRESHQGGMEFFYC